VTIRNSMQTASDQDFRKEVTIQTHGHDQYKRTLGDVILPDGTSVNHTLVKDGWCWWYREYALGIRCWKGLAHEAREGRKGLWTDPAPIRTWVFTQARRWVMATTERA